MPGKAEETVVRTETIDSMVCACGTHAGMKIAVCIIAGFIALFMLASAFASGVFIGKAFGRFDDGGRGGRLYQQQIGHGRIGMGCYGPGMMQPGGGGYGLGMMQRDRQGCYGEECISAPVIP